MKISALILTKNEEEMIESCLKQLDFADELIVLDQNSEDKTQKIAKKYTSKIFTTTINAFDKNRNTLAGLAHGDWLLYLDADERVNQEAILEIRKAIEENKYSAYYFPRKNMILGKWLRHGDWWPDYVPRLFKKDKLVTWHGQVHESPGIKGQFGYLNTPIEHLSARSLSKMLLKTINWAKLEAELFHKHDSHKVTILKVVKASTLEFVNRYIIKVGFLDGVVGLIQAIFQALHRAIILTYLWELQNE